MEWQEYSIRAAMHMPQWYAGEPAVGLTHSLCLPHSLRSSVLALYPSSSPAVMSVPRFGGGGVKCKTCAKTVYASEQMVYDGQTFHQECFKVSHAIGWTSSGVRLLLAQPLTPLLLLLLLRSVPVLSVWSASARCSSRRWR